MNIKSNDLLQEKLSQPVQLPALAKNMPALMQALADNNMNYQQLAKVIRHYPEITARLIFLANSSWSAPVAAINNIEQACSRLGISIVKSISIALSVASSFDTRKCPGFNTERFWTSSMLVSEGAGMLAAKLPAAEINLEFKNTAQTAGILHNLGLLWLTENFPAETDKVFQMATDESTSLSVNDLLTECIGTDYCKIGGWIAEQLELPDVLTCAIKYHLNPDYQGPAQDITQLIGSAAKMVSAIQKQDDVLAISSKLEIPGLDSSDQQMVFEQLSRKFEKTCELAKTLF